MLIFDMGCRSSATVAPVKHKTDSNDLRGTFTRSNFVYGEINEQSFSNTHPWAMKKWYTQ